MVTNDLVQVADLALANISASSINAPQANDVVHAFGESLTNITNSAVTGGTNAAVEAGEGATIQIYADSSFAGNPATVISSVASANDQAALASWEDALDGKRLLDDFAERGIQTWASPIDLLRLLWIRRDPRPVESDHWVETQKVLDLVVPGFDRLAAASGAKLLGADRPILPLALRRALLAGVAIVERSGPARLHELHRRAIGAYYSQFADIAGRVDALGQSTA